MTKRRQATIGMGLVIGAGALVTAVALGRRAIAASKKRRPLSGGNATAVSDFEPDLRRIDSGRDSVDQASWDSFPASDPPSF